VVDERVKPMFHTLGVNKNWKGMRQLGESTMRRTKINAKGQVTIPAELRERFGIKKGTRIDWKKDGGRLVLTPITHLRKKS
jgi:AbrB family looped-hinge helix DNA binding protein